MPASTSPFPIKQAILPLLDEVSADARQIGAVNTVTISDSGRTTGYNTDRSGFRRSVEEGLGRDGDRRPRVVLVGAGGAGRAVAFALMDLGAAHVAVHDVDAARATATVADLMAHFGAAPLQLRRRRRARHSREAAGVVNATPIGMLGIPGIPSPGGGAPPRSLRRRRHLHADGNRTHRRRARKGCRVLTGGGMCVHQAADAFRLFTGLEPDIPRMISTFATALAARDADLASGRAADISR